MISVIIRTFNNKDFIKKSIESALKQDFADYEVIIINDGSTDDTAEILSLIKDDKIRIINQENKGCFESGYVGLKNAKGDYIIFLDADDELKETALSDLFNSIKDNKGRFAYCDYYEVNLEGGGKKIVSVDNAFKSLACGILFEKSLFDEIEFWDKKMVLPEYDLFIRLTKKFKGVHVKKPLYIYNRHEQSMTADKKTVESAKKQIIEKYGGIG